MHGSIQLLGSNSTFLLTYLKKILSDPLVSKPFGTNFALLKSGLLEMSYKVHSIYCILKVHRQNLLTVVLTQMIYIVFWKSCVELDVKP